MEASEYLATVEALHRDARARRLFFQTAEDHALRGREVTVDGRSLLSFGSCSYLGLEQDPRLIDAAREGALRYGTQFSSSRGYLSAPPYAELEALLAELFGGHVLVTPSTTLGHIAALPVLITERDALVMDHQVHHSVQVAGTLVRAHGAHVSTIRHESLEQAVERIAQLARNHRHVWFATDGVTSMYGDLAPHALLAELLAVADNVRLYIDDAHGMSWDGRHGRGSFLRHTALEPRIVVATSLNKAFSASGGCLVAADPAIVERVRMLGGPMLFSGPLQPPMLATALASARLHLSDEIETLQATLRERVTLTNRLSRQRGLPLLVENEAPIFFYRLGLPRIAARVAEAMAADGIYVNISMYPTVPMKRAGVRISVNAIHTPEQIERLIDRLAVHIPAVLADEGLSREALDELFANAVVSHLGQPVPAQRAAATSGGFRRILSGVMSRPDGHGLVLDHHGTVDALDAQEWDRLFGEVGTCSTASLRVLEALHRDQPRLEHNWRYDYLLVREADSGRVVAATHTTVSLQKDDFLMSDTVSRAVEVYRRADPYFLTSQVLMTGSALSEGNHLYLDRSAPRWRQALKVLLDKIDALGRETDSTVRMLRDLDQGDEELDAFMLGEGYVKVPVLDRHVVAVDARGVDGLLASVGRSRRYQLRRTMAHAEDFELRFYHGEPLEAGLAARLFELYRAVARRKLRINVFELVPGVLEGLATSPAWEIVTLSARPHRTAGGEPGVPIGFYAAHRHGGTYAPFFCGLDERSQGQGYATTYRQLLLQAWLRAQALGMHTLQLGMDADVEKQRLGSVRLPACAYVQVSDHYQGTLLREIVEDVGLGRTEEA